MNTRKLYRVLLAAGLAFAMSGAVMSSVAQAGTEDPVKMKAIAEAAGLVSLEQAQEAALQAKPGTVIEVELDDRKWPSGWDYEFDIIDANGLKWDVHVDAKTGKVRKVKPD